MPADPTDFLEVEQGSGGTPVGPKLKGSLFIPSDMGIVFIDSNGNYWKTRVTPQGDSTATLDLVPVTF